MFNILDHTTEEENKLYLMLSLLFHKEITLRTLTHLIKTHWNVLPEHEQIGLHEMLNMCLVP